MSVTTVNRAQVLERLAGSKAELAARYDVTRLALFGSMVRDSVRAETPSFIRKTCRTVRPSSGS